MILLWSAEADASPWVRAEFETAITRGMDDGSLRVIPVLLDQTELPPLLRRIRWADLRHDDLSRTVNEIMGFATDQDRLLAIQEHLDAAGLEVVFFDGYGPLVCCPKCGAGVKHLEGWSDVDEARDDMYAGFRCAVCGFIGGSEL